MRFFFNNKKLHQEKKNNEKNHAISFRCLIFKSLMKQGPLEQVNRINFLQRSLAKFEFNVQKAENCQ